MIKKFKNSNNKYLFFDINIFYNRIIKILL